MAPLTSRLCEAREVEGSFPLSASLGTSTGAGGAGSFGRLASLFFSAVRRNTLMVVLRDLFGLQSSADSGECSHTGHEGGRFD